MRGIKQVIFLLCLVTSGIIYTSCMQTVEIEEPFPISQEIANNKNTDNISEINPDIGVSIDIDHEDKIELENKKYDDNGYTFTPNILNHMVIDSSFTLLSKANLLCSINDDLYYIQTSEAISRLYRYETKTNNIIEIAKFDIPVSSFLIMDTNRLILNMQSGAKLDTYIYNLKTNELILFNELLNIDTKYTIFELSIYNETLYFKMSLDETYNTDLYTVSPEYELHKIANDVKKYYIANDMIYCWKQNQMILINTIDYSNVMLFEKEDRRHGKRVLLLNFTVQKDILYLTFMYGNSTDVLCEIIDHEGNVLGMLELQSWIDDIIPFQYGVYIIQKDIYEDYPSAFVNAKLASLDFNGDILSYYDDFIINKPIESLPYLINDDIFYYLTNDNNGYTQLLTSHSKSGMD